MIKPLSFTAILVLLSSQALASRHLDLPSSGNGGNTPSVCATGSSATPFLLPLNGGTTCSPPSNFDQPNAVPNMVVSLQEPSSKFTVTITPVLWGNGANPVSSRSTILQTAFTSPAGLTLVSLFVKGAFLSPSHVVCTVNVGGSGPGPSLCEPLFAGSGFHSYANEPDAFVASDQSFTRWDFNAFSSGVRFPVVTAFPPNIDSADETNPNALPISIPAIPADSDNFLAIAVDSQGNQFFAGGLRIAFPAVSAANDFITAATTMAGAGFAEFVSLNGANPRLDGNNAVINLQSDPTPFSFSGVPCFNLPNGITTTDTRVLRSVWYTFAAYGSGPVILDTAGSHFDTRLAVFIGSELSPSTLTPIDCNDDNAGNQTSKLVFSTTGSSTHPTIYYVMVSETPAIDPSTGSSLNLPESADLSLQISISTVGLSITPVQLDFLVFPGQSETKSAILTAVNGNVTNILIPSNGNFSTDLSSCPAVLLAGNSCQVSITYSAPSVGGTFNSDLSVTSSATSGPLELQVTGGSNSPVGPDNSAFVEQQYVDFLDRQGDTVGLSGWVASLNNGGLSRPQLIANFMSSSEFAQKGKFVAQAYLGLLTRDADYGGFRGWLGGLEGGGSPLVLVDAFLNSGEFASKFGSNLNNTQFVMHMYENILLREPDPGGQSYWVGQLNGGNMTRAQVALAFLQSSEFAGIVSTQNRVTVSLLYFDMLRRQPDSGGFSGWVGAFNSGTQLTSVISAFYNSQEYASRF